MNKIFKQLLAIMLLLTSFSLPIQAANKFDSEGYIDNVSIRKWNNVNKEIESVDNNTVFHQFDKLMIRLDFKLLDNVTPGTESTFTLPAALDTTTLTKNYPILTDEGKEIATFIFDGTSNGILKVTDDAENAALLNKSGFIEFSLFFDENITNENQEVLLDFEFVSVVVVVTPPWESGGSPHDPVGIWKGGEFKEDDFYYYGQQYAGGRYIIWDLRIPGTTRTTNIDVTDEKGIGQNYVLGTFRANNVQPLQYESGVPYEDHLNFAADMRSFTFHLDELDLTYPLEAPNEKYRDLFSLSYLTEIDDSVDTETYSNRASLTATELQTVEIASESTVLAVNTGGNAQRRSVIVKKVDSENGESLTGAEFRLEKETTPGSWMIFSQSIVIDTVAGKQIDRLTYGNYRLIETKAADGYDKSVEGSVVATFNIDAQTPVTPVYTVTVTNDAILGSVELTKQDAETGEILQGAKFDLHKADGTFISSHTVDKNGKIMVANLRPGAYEFVETKAPEGYVLDATPIPFTITINDTETVSVTKTNEKDIETTTPQEETTTPQEETTTPQEETTTPQEETTTPQEETTTPQEETTTPQEETTTPQDETTAPQEETTIPQDETKTPQKDTKTPPTLVTTGETGIQNIIGIGSLAIGALFTIVGKKRKL